MNSPMAGEIAAQVGDYESLPTRSSLLARLRNVDDGASWRSFFDTYWQLIYNVARRSGLSDPEAQDVVQETVIAVARKMPAFRYDAARGSFKQWLLLIVRRRIQDHFRKLYRSLPASPPPPTDANRRLDEPAALTPPPDALIDAAWEEQWRANIFQQALARVRQRINPKHYQVFDFCVLQDMPAPKVAGMLGLSTAQVYLAKHRVSRAVKKAGQEIEGEYSRNKS